MIENGIQYFRDEIFELGESSSKAKGTSRVIDGYPLSKEMDDWLIEYKGYDLSQVVSQRNIIESLSDYLLTKQPIAGVLWDNNLIFLAQYFSRDIFVAHYEDIIDAFNNAGTIESYVKLIQIAIPQSSISVVNSAGRSTITIDLHSVADKFQVNNTSSNDEDLTVSTDGLGTIDDLYVKVNAESLSSGQVFDLLQSLNVNGRIVDIVFN